MVIAPKSFLYQQDPKSGVATITLNRPERLNALTFEAYAELRDTLRALAEHTRIVGFDLVEVNPMLDVGTGITSYLAAHTIVEFLGWLCAQPWWVAGREARGAARAGVRR